MVRDACARKPLTRGQGRPGPPSVHVGPLLSISRLAGGESGQAEQAHEALSTIRSIIPYQAASIAVWDPLTQEHRTKVNDGYPEAVAAHLNGRFVQSDELYRIMRTQDPLPLRWQDVPFDYRERHSARSVFIPAGFNEGTSVLLLSQDNRYTGILHVSVDSRRGITDEAVASLAWLQTLLSPIVDELGSWSRLVHRISPASSAIMIAASGAAVDMPDHEWAWLPHERDALVKSVLANWPALKSGTSRLLWRSSSGRWFKLWLQGLQPGVLLLIEEQEEGAPHSLTDREMAVVAGIAAGQSNQQLASALGVSVRTVAKHLENIMHKTSATSRTDLCARAYRDGFLALSTELECPV